MLRIRGGMVGRVVEGAFVAVPAEVGPAAGVAGPVVDLFALPFAHVGQVHVAVQRVNGNTPRVAQALHPQLIAAIVAHPRIVARDRVAAGDAAVRRRAACWVHINAQHGAEDGVAPLGVVVGVAGHAPRVIRIRPAVAGGDVEIAVRPKGQVAGVVDGAQVARAILVRLALEEQRLKSLGVDLVGVGGADGHARDRQGARRSVGEVDVGIGRIVGVERQAQKALLEVVLVAVGAQLHQMARVHERLGGHGAVGIDDVDQALARGHEQPLVAGAGDVGDRQVAQVGQGGEIELRRPWLHAHQRHVDFRRRGVVRCARAGGGHNDDQSQQRQRQP